MSDVRVKIFADYTGEGLEYNVNEFLSKPEVGYVQHHFMVDGLKKPYNLSLAYRPVRGENNVRDQGKT